jgi:hypothetical protein
MLVATRLASPMRQDDRDQRGTRGDDHERHAAKERDGDQSSDRKAEHVVKQPVTFNSIADFELHHRHAGKAR